MKKKKKEEKKRNAVLTIHKRGINKFRKYKLLIFGAKFVFWRKCLNTLHKYITLCTNSSELHQNLIPLQGNFTNDNNV